MTNHIRCFLKPRVVALFAGTALAVSGVGCTTAYDAYGRPIQTVDPAVAVAGIAAAGLIGYALADSRSSNGHPSHNYHRSRGQYGNHGYHRGGYYRQPSYYHGDGYCR